MRQDRDLEIEIREEASTGPNTSKVSIVIDGARFQATITDPFLALKQSDGEKRLEWYFEKWLKFPMLDIPASDEAARSIVAYGESLFEQLFSRPNILLEYDRFRQKAVNHPNVVIKICSTSPGFQGLHWEAIRDTHRKRPIALDLPLVRAEFPISGGDRAEYDETASIVRVLLVTSRPHGSRDVGYRTVSRPLLEALEQSNIPVSVDLLRPGSYSALARCLERRSNEHRPYHIVHFDVHGSLLTFEQLKALTASPGEATPRLMRFGRDELTEFEEVQGFLALEADAERIQSEILVDYVSAKELAQLLQRWHVPIVVLNACQTAKQVGTGETSLGAELVRHGARTAVAMSYSVTVTAAAKMMKSLYGELSSGAALSNCLRSVRRCLQDDKEREAYFGERIRLEDWILPVLYQQNSLFLRTRKMTPEEEAELNKKVGRQAPEPRTATGTFLGRDIDILEVERRLLRQNTLLISGFGGTGKSTLLRYLSFWWERTGWISRAVYVSYEDKAWTLTQILYELAKRYLEPTELKDFQSRLIEEQQGKIIRSIRSSDQRCLLVLDNLESTMGDELAFANNLPSEERQQIRSFLQRLVGENCFVLLGSRAPVSWIDNGVIDNNVYELKGLEPEPASELVARIFERCHIKDVDVASDPMQRLLRLLDGHPLALEVVIPNLRLRSPDEVLEALQTGIPDQYPGIRTRSILACIDYSHSNLAPEAKEVLECFAPFRSVLFEPLLGTYKTMLQNEDVLSNLAFERWDAVIAAVERLGLFVREQDAASPGYLRIQPLLSYFLALRLQGPERSEFKNAINRAFCQYSRRLADVILGRALSKDPDQRQIGQMMLRREFETMQEGLKIALDSHQSIREFYRALSKHYDVTNQDRAGAEFGEAVLSRLQHYPSAQKQPEVALEIVAVTDSIGRRMVRLGQTENAERHYCLALNSLESIDIPPSERRRLSATILFMLGVTNTRRRRFDLAANRIQMALDINKEFNNASQSADCLHELGAIAYEKLNFEKAIEYLERAIDLYEMVGDANKAAISCGQIGHVYFEMRSFAAAETSYKTALNAYEKYQDHRGAAMIFHSLGRLALEQSHFETAEECFRKALALKLEHLPLEEHTALNHQQIGALAEKRGDFPEAERNYVKSLDLFARTDDLYSQAMIVHCCVRLTQLWPECKARVMEKISQHQNRY